MSQLARECKHYAALRQERSPRLTSPAEVCDSAIRGLIVVPALGGSN